MGPGGAGSRHTQCLAQVVHLGWRTSLWKDFMTRPSRPWEHRLWSLSDFSCWTVTFISVILCSLPSLVFFWANLLFVRRLLQSDCVLVAPPRGLHSPPPILESASLDEPCWCFQKVPCWFVLFHNRIFYPFLYLRGDIFELVSNALLIPCCACVEWAKWKIFVHERLPRDFKQNWPRSGCLGWCNQYQPNLMASAALDMTGLLSSWCSISISGSRGSNESA